MISLMAILTDRGLTIISSNIVQNSLILEFEVYAKPGSKFEKISINNQGALEIKTQSRPVEGMANKSIEEMVGKYFGIAKSKVEIVRGEKSKNKRVQILIEFTAGKDLLFYQQKFTSFLKD